MSMSENVVYLTKVVPSSPFTMAGGSLQFRNSNWNDSGSWIGIGWGTSSGLKLVCFSTTNSSLIAGSDGSYGFSAASML